MLILEVANPAEIDLSEVLDLYTSVGWSAYTADPANLQAALNGSSTVVQALENSRLVGLARVVSDHASICYLQDILVRPEFQGRGIGRALAEKVLEPYAQVRQKVLLTDDEPGQQAFYEALGYTAATDYRGGVVRAFVRFDGK
jgi:GNAT superfamily N-acetyltransferase